jgi:hypothetical protein
MILRMTFLGCLLAAAGYAQLGTDGQPITMHNDPTTFFNGSLQVKFTTQTFMPQADVKGFSKIAQSAGPWGEGTNLLQHGHALSRPATQLIVVLQKSGPNTLQKVPKEIHFSDTDKLLLSLDNGHKILVQKTVIKGAGAKIPVHAHLSQAFANCLSAVKASVPAGAAASQGGHPGKTATNVNWISPVTKVALGTKISLTAAVTSIGGTIPSFEATLWDNGVKTMTAAVSNGAQVHFTVTPSNAPYHCFAIEYPGTSKFDNSKSAETCLGILPTGCPVMNAADLKAYADHAAEVADTVWVIYGDQGWKSAQKDEQDSQATIVSYGDPNAHIVSVQIEGKTKTIIDVEKDCGAVHFCKMLDTKDAAGKWTMTPDCGQVKFQCHDGQTYTWTP